jgi:lactaldehyde dehydrogenase/glycolaldehyde dehydrogenase
VVGDPRQRETRVGPKVGEPELDKALGFVTASVAAGAQLRAGGERIRPAGFENGFWMAPTVLTGVADDMDIMRRDVFGPVTPISPFGSWDEVAARANDSRYGLSAYVYTADLRTAMRASRDLSFGEVYVNRVGPEEVNGFHAGFRESGLGDDGPHGLEGYYLKQTVYMRY